MKKTVSRTPLGGNLVRYRVTVRDEGVYEEKSLEGRGRLHQFGRDIWQQPDIVACGYEMPKSILITHNGEQWQAVAQETVEES